MELKEIKQIVELMDKHGLTEFELERDGQKISLKRGQTGLAIAPAAPAPAPLPQAIPAPAASPAPEEKPDPAPAAESIKSPMVGTFYRRPSPDQENFVKVGDAIDEDTVVCIIEAMKVMNEIKAETRGIVTKILLDDASPVQYGEPLFEIKPA